MGEPNLKAEMRAKAILRQAYSSERIATVIRRGDPDAGVIFVVLRDHAGGHGVLAPVRDTSGALTWSRVTGTEPVDQAAIDAYFERQMRRDPDLWILEVEGPDLDFAPPY